MPSATSAASTRPAAGSACRSPSANFPKAAPAPPPPRKDQEAAALLAALPQGAMLVALDETGRNLDSRAFAQQIARWRDDGVAELVFAIGGADGLGAGNARERQRCAWRSAP